MILVILKKYLYIALTLISFALVAQRKYEAFDIVEEGVIVPPNGILLSGNTFMDDSEVMNSHYLEYLHFLSQDSSDASIIKAYPDTTIFGKAHLNKFLQYQKEYYKKKGNKHKPVSLLFHDEVMHEPSSKHHWYNYFSYHGTKHCPVVGITYEQALNYCKWRSDFVSGYFNSVLKKKSKYKALKDKNIRFEFSLPTEAEWNTAASAGLDIALFPLGVDEIRNDSSQMFNIHFSNESLKGKNKNEPEFIFSHVPNSAGYYNFIGNVSEMVLSKGISKGGGFIHTAQECRISNQIVYMKPEKWLGFRCVCRVYISPLVN